MTESLHYIEKFTIYKKIYGIAKDLDNHYFIYMTGTRLGDASTLEEARNLLYNYVLSQIRAEYYGAVKIADETEKILNWLERDPFYLGKFATE